MFFGADWHGHSANGGSLVELDLFRCSRCFAALSQRTDGAIQCSACGKSVPFVDGILDFVGSSVGTALDNLDYDQFYRIDDAYSDLLVKSIRSYAGEHWPSSFGVVLELGCGTGGFSRALLRVEAPDRILFTDVSAKMLRICREHLNRMGLLAGRRVSFATYSGVEPTLASAAFDTCVGTSVLHHITDVRSCLVDLHRALKPNGQALFLEPNWRFHRALYATLADVVAFYLADGHSGDDPDLARILNWIAEVRCICLHAGDLDFLAKKEDKHMFVSEEIEALARDAGFAIAQALPATVDPAGTHTAEVYLTQCEVSETRRRDTQKLMRVFQSRYFSRLNPRDQAASFVLSLRKSALAGPRFAHSTNIPPDASAELAGHDFKLRCHLDIRAINANAVSVEGWCLAVSDIKWLRLNVDNVIYEVPVWLPRMDVQLIINKNGIYPSHNALCSGVKATIALAAPVQDDLTIAIDAVLLGGCAITITQSTQLKQNVPMTMSA